MRNLALIGLSAIALAACGSVGHAQNDPVVASAVADSLRPAADVARDAARKPAEIVEFAGVKPGDSIAELVPGGGYYTRILAKAVGPTGHVYALVPPFLAQRPGALDGINALAAQYPNVSVVTVDFAEFAPAKPVDLVWTTENYHDLHNGPNANVAGDNAAVFKALKPGGIYFVEDHSAPGAGTSVTSTLHRIDPASVIEEVTAAGFTLEAQSDAVANPADAHDKPVFDPAIRGQSDKFALRFRKPG